MLDTRQAGGAELLQVIAGPQAKPVTAVMARSIALANAAVAAWEDVQEATAAAYLVALRELVRYIRDHPLKPLQRAGVTFGQVGPYVVVGELGIGGFGQAAAAYHRDTGQRVCVKLPAGSEGFVHAWLNGEWPPQCLQVYEDGAFARDPEREQRLRRDDCAMLAGLLVDLLGRDRWALFDRAIRAHPLCETRYTLTGRGKVDRQLSHVINRAWLGTRGVP